MEYRVVIWDPFQQNPKDELEEVQHQTVRYVMHICQQTASVIQMLHQLQWEILETRRRLVNLIMLYKIVNNVVDTQTDQLIRPTRAKHAHKFKH